jgi:hypothetical protein
MLRPITLPQVGLVPMRMNLRIPADESDRRHSRDRLHNNLATGVEVREQILIPDMTESYHPRTKNLGFLTPLALNY